MSWEKIQLVRTEVTPRLWWIHLPNETPRKQVINQNVHLVKKIILNYISIFKGIYEGV